MTKTTVLRALCLTCIALLLAGCNTFRGFGQDMKAAGEKIEDAGRKK